MKEFYSVCQFYGAAAPAPVMQQGFEAVEYLGADCLCSAPGYRKEYRYEHHFEGMGGGRS